MFFVSLVNSSIEMNSMLIKIFYSIGFKLLIEDMVEARKIKVKMNTNGIPFKELPYREMERLRLVGLCWTQM